MSGQPHLNPAHGALLTNADVGFNQLRCTIRDNFSFFDSSAGVLGAPTASTSSLASSTALSGVTGRGSIDEEHYASLLLAHVSACVLAGFFVVRGGVVNVGDTNLQTLSC